MPARALANRALRQLATWHKLAAQPIARQRARSRHSGCSANVLDDRLRGGRPGRVRAALEAGRPRARQEDRRGSSAARAKLREEEERKEWQAASTPSGGCYVRSRRKRVVLARQARGRGCRACRAGGEQRSSPRWTAASRCGSARSSARPARSRCRS